LDASKNSQPLPEMAVIIIVEPTFQSCYCLYGHMSTVTHE